MKLRKLVREDEMLAWTRAKRAGHQVLHRFQQFAFGAPALLGPRVPDGLKIFLVALTSL